MKTVLLCVGLMAVISSQAYGREDDPLKWKMQRWEYVVVVEAGDEVGNNEQRHVENRIVMILRGQKEKPPPFEWWRHKEHVKGQLYLMCYHKAPPGTSAWESFEMKKAGAGFSILKFHTDDQTVFYGTKAKYKDMDLEELKKLIELVPFEADETRTEYYKNGMIKPKGPKLSARMEQSGSMKTALHSDLFVPFASFA